MPKEKRTRAYWRAWEKANPGRITAYRLRARLKRQAKSGYIAVRRKDNLRRYGITPEDYAVMFAEQEGRCYICGREETTLGNSGRVRHLSVDHDHATGRVRRLLCTRCNPMVGYAGDNPAILEKAAAYLRQFGVL